MQSDPTLQDNSSNGHGSRRQTTISVRPEIYEKLEEIANYTSIISGRQISKMQVVKQLIDSFYEEMKPDMEKIKSVERKQRNEIEELKKTLSNQPLFEKIKPARHGRPKDNQEQS